MISDGFIINPYYELLPDYKICPFQNTDMFINRSLPLSNSIEDYLSARFYQKEYTFTFNAREAIYLALSVYKLQPEDIVTIFTTTGNFYISSCVTREIEKFCRWSRKIETNTKLLFVNHEFGYPYKALHELTNTGLPVIEDCAHSFFSNDENEIIGTVGDFVIYSFPKMFPLQIGGLLVSNIHKLTGKRSQIDDLKLKYLKNVLSYHLKYEENIINKRISNYNFLKAKFESLGFAERFNLDKGIVPGVFMFSSNGLRIDLPELKKYFYANGVQCSVFYGEESFFIPVHQGLDEQDMIYFYEIMRSFMQSIEP